MNTTLKVIPERTAELKKERVQKGQPAKGKLAVKVAGMH